MNPQAAQPGTQPVADDTEGHGLGVNVNETVVDDTEGHGLSFNVNETVVDDD